MLYNGQVNNQARPLHLSVSTIHSTNAKDELNIKLMVLIHHIARNETA